ncbi:MAG: ABC transporter permease [Acidimicrobiales bacterium]
MTAAVAPETDRPTFSWLRVRTVVRRHGYVLFRSPHRWFDIAFWPVFDVLLFGSLGAFVAQQNETSQAATPYLLAGIMLFHVLFQSQIAVATGFMEETWTRNILNVMTTPLREVEYVLGLALMGLMKLAAAMVTVSAAALVFYRFGLGEIGWGLVPVIGVLLLCGWCTAMLVIGLLLRYGQSAEILAWATTFVLLALSGVFNPVESLPGAIQPIAKLLPTTYAFRAARDLLDGGPIPWHDLLLATIGAFVLAALAMVYVVRMLRVFRHRGYVTRYS